MGRIPPTAGKRLTSSPLAAALMLAEELEAEFKEVDRQEFHQVVAIAQQLDTGTVHKLREEFTTGSDEDACYLLDGEDKKMYFMCSSPPDNPNMYCEEMADGMDWVCVVEDDAFTRDLLDDFSA